MDRALIVADDLTGAAEIAAFLADATDPARITWPSTAGLWDPAAPRQVIDTESRNLSPDRAYERMAALARRIPRERLAEFTFKKIDSTLRGPIRAELSAWSEVTRVGPVVAAPAYPRMGRTTVGGVQYLDSVPVAAGPAGDDPLAAAEDSEVWRVLPPGDHVVVPAPARGGAGALAERLARYRMEGRHVVVDAVEDADLVVLADALRRMPAAWVVGSGGLARHLWPSRDLVRVADGPGALVVIVGSHHPAARLQIASLCRTYRCVVLTNHREGIPMVDSDTVLVLATPPNRIDPGAASAAIQDQLEEVIALGRPRAVVVTGGATALHVLERVGAMALDVSGELVHGVPLGRIVGGVWVDTMLAAKAGGFGAPDLLAQAVGALRVDVSRPA
jgi:D-threonate/D-erythronate kinase